MKAKQYSERQVRIAALCKALAHPARLAIVEFLLQQDRCVCGDIVNELPLSQSTVSQHLKALKNVGLIQGTISGPSVCYCIHPQTWDSFSKELEVFFHRVTQLNYC